MEINVNQFKGLCSCTREHVIDVEEIYVEEGATNRINDFLHKHNWTDNIGIVCDDNTILFARQIITQLKVKHVDLIMLDAKGLHADEHGIDQIVHKLEGIQAVQVLLAVGAGTIHDLTRYVANDQKIAFISVPTAASVDGFVSTVSAMTIKGCKKTLPGSSPLAVFADTHIFSKAPYRLTASGVSDLLGKYTALLDWKVGHLLTDEYICERVIKMEEDAILQVRQSLEGLKKDEVYAHESLMYALLLSGLAMQMIGNSRPASGAEHHMSHLWEMHVINEPLEALHGEKVGVGLVLACKRYKKILQIPDIQAVIHEYTGLTDPKIGLTFKGVYSEICDENKVDCMSNISAAKVVENFDKIKELVRQLPSYEEIVDLLKRAGALSTIEEIKLTEDIIEDSYYYSPFVRNRLTLMRVLTMVFQLD